MIEIQISNQKRGENFAVSVSKVKICKGMCNLVSVFIVLRVDKV